MSDAGFDFFAAIFSHDQQDRAKLALSKLDNPSARRVSAVVVNPDAYRPALLSRFGCRVTIGKTTVQNGGTISHGLSAAPSYVILTPTVAKRICGWTGSTSTTFTVSLHDDAGSAIGSPGEDVCWMAFGDQSTPPDYEPL